MRYLVIICLLFICTVSDAKIVRIVYKPDKSVAILDSIKSLDDYMIEAGYAGCEYEDIDTSLLPSREYRSAWEGNKTTGITINQTGKGEIDQKDTARTQLIDTLKTELSLTQKQIDLLL